MCWICNLVAGLINHFKKDPPPPPPREIELIGWAHDVNNPHDVFQIHRYIPHANNGDWGPAQEDGSDRDGDFWTMASEVEPYLDNWRGKPNSHFVWCDAPDPLDRAPITSTHILEALKRSGKITDEDILSAKAAVKLMGSI